MKAAGLTSCHIRRVWRNLRWVEAGSRSDGESRREKALIYPAVLNGNINKWIKGTRGQQVDTPKSHIDGVGTSMSVYQDPKIAKSQ